MIQLLLAITPLISSLAIVTGIWLLIAWAGRTKKESNKYKTHIKKHRWFEESDIYNN